MNNKNTRRGQTQTYVAVKNQVILKSFREPIRLPSMFTNGGFTLIEILVVVLIIGILGAIALPQYQRSVLRSRFAALMPIAKSMADSNEAFYLEHGEYADNAQDLPIQGRRNYSDGTELEFGTTTSHAYVLATRDNDFPNNYIVYQKHSEQYPGEIHCEAAADNTLAQDVCKSFGATQDIGETLTPNYLTYVLFGTGHGEPPTGDEGGNDEGNDTPTCAGLSCDEEGNIIACANGQTLHNNSCEDCTTAFPGATTCSTASYTATSCDIGYVFSEGKCTTPTYNCLKSQLNTTTPLSKATCTQVCDDVNNPDCYKWTDGKNFTNMGCDTSKITSSSPYACAGGYFSTRNGQSQCWAYDSYGCAGSTFESIIDTSSTSCWTNSSYGCANSTFIGDGAYCDANAAEGCTGSIILGQAACRPGKSTGCNKVMYGAQAGEDPDIVGSCDNSYNACPNGVLVNRGGGHFVTGWKGGYCDPNYMASGVCPNGSPKQGGGWNGGYCKQINEMKCPAGSPTPNGQCWDGYGREISCN